MNFKIEIRAFKAKNGSSLSLTYLTAAEMFKLIYVAYIDGPGFIPCENDNYSLCLNYKDPRIKTMMIDATGNP